MPHLDWTSLGSTSPQTWALLALGVAVATLIFLAGWQVIVRAARPRQVPHTRGPESDLPGFHSDRRATQLRGGNPVEVDVADGADLPRPAWVVDRSYGGLCLRVSHPFAENSVVRVRPRGATSTPWTQLRVRSCHPDNAVEWTLHCQFLQTPNWGVLHQFG